METLLKNQFVGVINSNKVGTAPDWTTEPIVRCEDISDSQFSIVDSKDDPNTIKRPFGGGAASYYNGSAGNSYVLRFISFDDYLHQFVFDDGHGHPDASMIKKHTKVADMLVYNIDGDPVYFLIHELCVGNIANKRATAKIQLSSTLNLLYQSADVKQFVDSFERKICYLSAKDGRVATPNNVADGFMDSYRILPDPLPFTYGQIKKCGFEAYETSIVNLDKP